ncbi:hypothetical protein JHK82_043568 [Glycine max]|nr:hypothetical protein JHK82_043568 [Glycine max]
MRLDQFFDFVSSLILHKFPNFSVKFVRRQANAAAHALAKAAANNVSPYFYNTIPHCISYISMNESA